MKTDFITGVAQREACGDWTSLSPLLPHPEYENQCEDDRLDRFEGTTPYGPPRISTEYTTNSEEPALWTIPRGSPPREATLYAPLEDLFQGENSRRPKTIAMTSGNIQPREDTHMKTICGSKELWDFLLPIADSGDKNIFGMMKICSGCQNIVLQPTRCSFQGCQAFFCEKCRCHSYPSGLTCPYHQDQTLKLVPEATTFRAIRSTAIAVLMKPACLPTYIKYNDSIEEHMATLFEKNQVRSKLLSTTVSHLLPDDDEWNRQVRWIELNPRPLSFIVLDWKMHDTSEFSETLNAALNIPIIRTKSLETVLILLSPWRLFDHEDIADMLEAVVNSGALKWVIATRSEKPSDVVEFMSLVATTFQHGKHLSATVAILTSTFRHDAELIQLEAGNHTYATRLEFWKLDKVKQGLKCKDNRCYTQGDLGSDSPHDVCVHCSCVLQPKTEQRWTIVDGGSWGDTWVCTSPILELV